MLIGEGEGEIWACSPMLFSRRVDITCTFYYFYTCLTLQDQKSRTFRVAVAFDQFLIIIQNTLLYFLIPAGTAQKLTLKVPLLVVFLFFFYPFFL